MLSKKWRCRQIKFDEKIYNRVESPLMQLLGKEYKYSLAKIFMKLVWMSYVSYALDGLVLLFSKPG